MAKRTLAQIESENDLLEKQIAELTVKMRQGSVNDVSVEVGSDNMDRKRRKLAATGIPS